MSEPKPQDSYDAGEEPTSAEEPQEEIVLRVTKLAVRPDIKRGPFNCNSGTAYVEFVPEEPWLIRASVPTAIKDIPEGVAYVLANQFAAIMDELVPILEQEEQTEEGFA